MTPRRADNLAAAFFAAAAAAYVGWMSWQSRPGHGHAELAAVDSGGGNVLLASSDPVCRLVPRDAVTPTPQRHVVRKGPRASGVHQRHPGQKPLKGISVADRRSSGAEVGPSHIRQLVTLASDRGVVPAPDRP